MRVTALILCLMLLIGCSSAPVQVIKTEYVYQQVPPLPNAPALYPVKWQKIERGYLLDEQNAKNWLKNEVLKKQYAGELLLILESLKQRGESK